MQEAGSEWEIAVVVVSGNVQHGAVVAVGAANSGGGHKALTRHAHTHARMHA